jgi:predicted outer membrane repeat protein
MGTLMATLTVGPRWLQVKRLSRTCKRRADFPNRQRSRLSLELLECRCVPSTVTNLADAGPGSLRDALAETPAGGTVDFQPGLSGTITLTSGELAINKDLTIAGPGVNVITISGGNASRVFSISASTTVTLSGLSISNGYVAGPDARGGGIYNSGLLTLSVCILSENTSRGIGSGESVAYSYGGGIYNTGMLTLTATLVSDNSATGGGRAIGSGGGGIYNAATGTVSVTDSTLSDNPAVSLSVLSPRGVGGGIDNDGGTVTVTDSTLNSNAAGVGGGGIYSQLGMLTVTSSSFSGNSTNGAGGGIANEGGTLLVSSSEFSHNLVTNTVPALGVGGGISNDGTATATDCTFVNNSAATGGGALFNRSDSTLTITNCNIDGNSARFGGGIENDFGSLSIIGSRLSNNAVTYSFGLGGGIDNLGTLTISSSTLSGNTAFEGGGIANSSVSTVTITDSTLSGNSTPAGTTSMGGGIFNDGTLALTNCLASNNASDGDGGGIVNRGTCSIVDSRLISNSAGFTQGGGIFNRGTLTVIGSVISGNLCHGLGGGIESEGVGSLTIIDSTISDNTASGLLPGGGGGAGGGIANDTPLVIVGSIIRGNSAVGFQQVGGGGGGGIANSSGTMVIIQSTVSGNTAVTMTGTMVVGGKGGGILTTWTLTVNGCTISGNSATEFGTGGGIWSEVGMLTVANSTIQGNVALDGGGIYSGGIYARSGTISSSTISQNSATFGGGIEITGAAIIHLRNTLVAGNAAPSSPDVAGLLSSLGHNLIGDGTGGSGFAGTDLVGTSTSPIDPLLAPLGDYGGPTQTMALLPGSPALDVGGLTDSEWDQRGPGYARLINGATDIGAYEVQENAVRVPVARSGFFRKGLNGTPATSPSPAAVPTLSVPGTPTMNVPASPDAAAVDSLFAWHRNDSVGNYFARLGHPGPGEINLWVLDPFPAE